MRHLTLANAASTSIARPPRGGKASGSDRVEKTLYKHDEHIVARESTVDKLHLCPQSELRDVQIDTESLKGQLQTASSRRSSSSSPNRFDDIYAHSATYRMTREFTTD